MAQHRLIGFSLISLTGLFVLVDLVNLITLSLAEVPDVIRGAKRRL